MCRPSGAQLTLVMGPLSSSTVTSSEVDPLEASHRPQVHRVAQSNGQHVIAPPVEQVEVVVINEFRCVQSPLRRLRIISGQIRNHHPIDSSTEKQDGHQSVVQCTNLITWGMWRRCLAGLAWWEEAAVFSGSGGLFLKARIRVRLLSSFSASSLRYASLDGDAAAFSLSFLGSVSR